MVTHYFSPGPASLPTAVRERIHKELLDTFGIGVSVMEVSHRSSVYGQLNEETLALARKVFQVPESHSILLSAVGAAQHFSLLIQHLSVSGETIAYTDTGVWAHQAVEEAMGTDRKVVLAYDGRPDYRSLGDTSKWNVPKDSRYLHITVNNTVYGTEYPKIPDHFDVPLVLDMTSSLAARTDIPWEKTAVVYASAQKNFGIAGISVVIIKNDVLEQSKDFVKRNQLGRGLSYPALFVANSIFNTPPVMALFGMNRMLQWIDEAGGTPAMEKLSLEKANAIYSQLDAGFYTVRPERAFRSRHNIVFSLPTPELDEKFIQEAMKLGILEIRGYRGVGGIRASIYNGVSLESSLVLADFIRDFRLRHHG